MGAYLRAARSRRRVSIDRAAEQTRIRADFLMRMESDEFDFLAPAYVRGFLKNYARFLRVDPDPLLEEFDTRWGGGRFDTGQLVSIDRRNKQTTPREPRHLSNWTIAAMVAGVLLVIFAVVGVIVGPEDEDGRPDVLADADETAKPTKTPTPKITPTATVVPTETPTGTEVAFADGIEVEVIAANSDCWVDITADGVNVYSGTLELGESESFTAEEEMALVLGFPDGVELVVNGQELGSPGGVDPITIKFPDDLDSLQ
jgi:cytoskeletal protein RodZ